MTHTPSSPTLYTTADGSPTLYSPLSGEHYHSVHGAVQESLHIFIEYALAHRARETDAPLNILEVGFGTGLNALLTLRWATDNGRLVNYTTLEKFPIPTEVYRQLQYTALPGSDSQLQALHEAPWEKACSMAPHFQLTKLRVDLCQLPTTIQPADIIYFDAFSPEAQPELWTEEIFVRLYQLSRPGAVLTTYCAKGEVRRRLQRAGFVVERLPGPIGKREVLRATRP